MSQEAQEVVRAWWSAMAEWFNSPRDPEGLAQITAQYTAPDVVYEEDPIWPDAGAFRGRDAVVARFVEYADLLQIRSVRSGEVIDAGDVVLAEAGIEMLGRDAGEPVSFLWTYTVRVVDGRVAQFRAWYERAEALEAAGLSEEARGT